MRPELLALILSHIDVVGYWYSAVVECVAVVKGEGLPTERTSYLVTDAAGFIFVR